MPKTTTMPMRLQMSLLTSVLEFMYDSGVSAHQIGVTTRKCLGVLSSRKPRAQVGGSSYQESGDLSADLLRQWHRDGNLLDANEAAPRPLHLEKGRHSIKQLVKRLNPQADLPALLNFLLDSGLVRRLADGRYLPSTEAGAISRTERFVSEHTAKSVVRLLSTVKRNARKMPGSESLIERFAYVSDLNPSQIEEFCAFTRSQGHNYLQLVDDWMEQRRMKPPTGRNSVARSGVAAGVQIIAYLGDPPGERARSPKKRKARRPDRK